MRCLFCHRPYDDRDVFHTPSAVVYRCRNCDGERTISRTTIAGVYGREAATHGRRAVIDQARRLEG